MKTLNKIFTFLILLNLTNFALNGQNEPLINLEVIVNGEKYNIKDGDTLDLPNNQIIVKSADFKTFDFGVVNFNYPKHFAFSYEEDVAYKNWILDGNNFVLMYFEIGVQADIDAFVNQMTEQFGPENCKISDKEIQLGDIKLLGKRINVILVGQHITYDMYKINTEDKNSHFIAFQDSKNEDGSDSEESIETMNIIAKTFKQD